MYEVCALPMPVLFMVVAAVLLHILCGFISKKLTGKVQTAFVFTHWLLLTALAAFAIFLLVLANSTELRSLWFATVFGPLMLKGDGLTPLRCGEYFGHSFHVGSVYSISLARCG